MRTRVKINGVYDESTIDLLTRCQVSDLSFDLRPKSLNFIQTYKIAELLQKTRLMNVYLQFANEKDFVIDKVLSDLNLHNVCKELYLEFYDHRTSSYYDQFEKPYFLHINHTTKVDPRLFEGKYLVGISLDYDFLLSLYQYGDLATFVSQFYGVLGDRANSMVIGLQRRWDADIYPSICHFFDFKMMSLPIDSCVELNFRQVNLIRVEKELKLLPSIHK